MRAVDKRYRPYDLISVPKDKVNREHFVFSVFGVLHVVANQPSETLLLEEWYKYAVLWEACSKIAFFKNFLVKKMFRRFVNEIFDE